MTGWFFGVPQFLETSIFIHLQISATKMGRTWATVQIASQDFFVQTGGVAPPILYLESCCSWFLSNHHFHFVVVYVELVEASNINSRGQHLIQLKSIIDNYKMFSEFMLVGTLDGKDPTTKCHWEKIMLAIPTFSYFLNFRCIGFCSTGFELFSEPERVMFFIL